MVQNRLIGHTQIINMWNAGVEHRAFSTELRVDQLGSDGSVGRCAWVHLVGGVPVPTPTLPFSTDYNFT